MRGGSWPCPRTFTACATRPITVCPRCATTMPSTTIGCCQGRGEKIALLIVVARKRLIDPHRDERTRLDRHRRRQAVVRHGGRRAIVLRACCTRLGAAAAAAAVAAVRSHRSAPRVASGPDPARRGRAAGSARSARRRGRCGVAGATPPAGLRDPVPAKRVAGEERQTEVAKTCHMVPRSSCHLSYACSSPFVTALQTKRCDMLDGDGRIAPRVVVFGHLPVGGTSASSAAGRAASRKLPANRAEILRGVVAEWGFGRERMRLAETPRR